MAGDIGTHRIRQEVSSGEPEGYASAITDEWQQCLHRKGDLLPGRYLDSTSMKSDPRFLNMQPEFWPYLRMISDRTAKGYQISSYEPDQLVEACRKIGLSADPLVKDGNPSSLGRRLIEYLNHRYELLQSIGKKLRTLDEALRDYEEISHGHTPRCYKVQYTKKKIRQPLVLANTVNFLTETALGGVSFDADPNKLITVLEHGGLLHTICRRMDGAYPSVTDARAIWEVKEYYVGGSFGSRIADGIYETMLVGTELADLKARFSLKVHHYLLIDGKDEWWNRGKSYLCRILDILHQGYIDQALFGREVLEEWPRIVRSW